MRKPKTVLTHWDIRKGKKFLHRVEKERGLLRVSGEDKLLTFPQVMTLVSKLGARRTPRFNRIL